MILILGSSRRAASQSVVTSGSSVDDVTMRYSGRFPFSSLPGLTRQSIALERDVFEGMDTRVKPACDGLLTLRLLRLEFLDRTAGVAPGREAAGHVRDRLQAHVLRGLGGQRRTHAAGAVKDELLVALEDRLGIGARRIRSEFQHAAGARESAGNSGVALD